MITQPQKDKINQYASIKQDIKLLETKADELNKEVLEIMEQSGAEEIELATGKLSLGSRRSWKYTDKVKTLDEQLKEQKKLEEQTGEADYTEKKYCIFKGNKDE